MAHEPTSPPFPASASETLQAGLVEHARRHHRHETDTSSTPCKVCGGNAALFDLIDFAKTCNQPAQTVSSSGIPVCYRRCAACGFIATHFFDNFTPEQWTSLVYNAAYYTDVDPEYREIRPRGNAAAVDALLCDHRSDWRGLDYGGGNGSTANRLRSLGYEYDCYDPFGYSTARSESRGSYNFCSVFEVAEHTPYPKAFMADLASWCRADRAAILVGTHVHDKAVFDDRKLAWWYAAPRNGHVSLHSRQSLNLLAHQFGFACLSLTEQTHLLTRGYTPIQARWFLLKGKLRGRLRAWRGPQPPRSV